MPRPRSDWTARRTRVRPHHCWSESGGPGAITCIGWLLGYSNEDIEAFLDLHERSGPPTTHGSALPATPEPSTKTGAPITISKNAPLKRADRRWRT